MNVLLKTTIKLAIRCLIKLAKRNERPSFGDIAMMIAILNSMRSTCCEHRVGACILNEENIIVGSGYNGPPRSLRNCNAQNCFKKCGGSCVGVHAEMNAIFHASANVKGATVYVTKHPCIKCIVLLIQNGIKHIVYLEDYKRVPSLIDSHVSEEQQANQMFTESGVTIEQFQF